MDRKSMIFAGFVLGLAIVAGGRAPRARAQEAPPPPPAQFVPAPPPAPEAAPAPPPPPEQYVPPPAPDVVVSPPPPQGQWVQTAEYGLVWVPAGTVTYAVGDTPCAYLYTPTYGWTWYASPWGPGRFAIGAWVGRRSPYGYRAWAPGPRGWGWHRGPRVSIQIAPRVRAYGHAYPSRAYPQYRNPHHGYGGGYGRSYRGGYDGYGRGYRGGYDGYGRGQHGGRRGYR